MWLRDLLTSHAGVLLIDLIGSLLVVAYVVAAIVSLLRTRAITQARLIVAEGAVLGLSFKTAGTLLKTLELHTWNQILTFTAILTLRILLKQLFVWEQGQLKREFAQPHGRNRTGPGAESDSVFQ